MSNFRNINGFLNTGKGGTVYLGIVDDGKVKGLHMTQYQVSIGVHGYTCSLQIQIIIGTGMFLACVTKLMQTAVCLQTCTSGNLNSTPVSLNITL